MKKKSLMAVGLCLSVAGLAAVAMGARGDGERSGGSGDESRIRRGFDVTPVHLDLRGKNRARVGLGSYLVNAVGGCNDCHTCPTYAPGAAHNPFIGGDGMLNAQGHLAGGVPFALGPNRTIHSANLTPDARGLPAGLTFDDFRMTLRTGPDHEQMDRFLQVMPWPVFRNMIDGDLRSMDEYLRSIPSRETPAPGSCQNPGQATFSETR